MRKAIPLIALVSVGTVLSAPFQDQVPFMPTALEGQASPVKSQQDEFSGDVTTCQGYRVDNVSTSSTGGISASLSILARCNAYGIDIPSLTLSVEYETKSRLHVHIYDTAQHQYQIDETIIPRPSRTLASTASGTESELDFQYNESPFEFWVTRKQDGQVLFDTRAKNIPTYDDAVEIQDEPSDWTVMPAHPLIFEDQYLQISNAVQVGANIYGLGEYIGASGYRRNSSATVQTFWTRDIGDPVDENMYGSHPIYMEARWDEKAQKTTALGAVLLNSHGMDVVLRDGVMQYRVIGGTLDFYIFSGPTPNDVTGQYAHTTETKEQVDEMRQAGIPLEVMWNDIDWMKRYRQFQFDVNYPIEEFGKFVDDLHEAGQYYIPIIDAGIAILYNETDHYDLFERGVQEDVWIKNPDGTYYYGEVWPGITVYADWFHPKMAGVWYEAFKNFSQKVDFDGIWLDMNEASSHYQGSVFDAKNPFDFKKIHQDFSNPPTDLSRDWPEGYNNTLSGNSGNISINGSLTYGQDGSAPTNTAGVQSTSLVDWVEARRVVEEKLRERAADPVTSRGGTGLIDHHIEETKEDAKTIMTMKADQATKYKPTVPYLDYPPYPIRHGGGALSYNTLNMNATHANGLQEYQAHSLWGFMEEIATHDALEKLRPGKRAFTVSRSTFAGAGRVTTHWLGDNFSSWAYMKRAIQGVLQFNLFAIPMVGPDACGFNHNTNEELCNRWMQLSAFFPFFRNHNSKDTISQEPYRWESVIEASIIAIKARYALLPYWETLFAEVTTGGPPPIRALFHEFDQPDLYDIDSQFLIGPSILVSPQLQPNSTTVTATFPSVNGVTWTNWWTHKVVDTSSGDVQTVDAPLSSIPVHIRSGSVLLTHSNPGYTLGETRKGGYGLVVVLDKNGFAGGTARLDDGLSWPVTQQTQLTFTATNGKISASVTGTYTLPAKLTTITILGLTTPPDLASVSIIGEQAVIEYIEETQEMVITGLSSDLNEGWEVRW